MVIEYPQISKEQIQEAIRVYVDEYKRQPPNNYNVNIEHVLIEYHDVKIAKNGFHEDYTNASTYFAKGKENKVEKVCFYCESIKNYLETTLNKISDKSFFYSICNCYLKFIILHEFWHIQQIEECEMTIEEYKQTNYEDNPFEEAANKAAEKAVLGNASNRHLLPIAIGKVKIDNDNYYEYLAVYNKE